MQQALQGIWGGWREAIQQFGLLLFAFVTGTVGYLALSLWFPSGLLTRLLEVGKAVYHKVGITVLGLAPLSIYLLVVLVLLFREKAGAFEFARNPRYHLLWIENASPMLGFLGTLIGLAEAMSGLDTSKGIQPTVVWLTAKVGQAIWSSIYGAIQALLAYGVRFVFELDGEGGDG